ncbi:hypothetical protein ACYZT8_07555 [Pseudomonas sp. LB3P93]
MLVPPRRQPVSLLLRPPEIPGARLLEYSADEWAINRAAALDNFPDHGLKVYVPAWSAMGKGDKVELLFNSLVVDQHTLTEDTEVGERVTLWVAPKHWLTGPHTLAYRVTRFNQGPETYAPALKLYAKLEIPAGQDTDEAEGSHSNLYMVFDPPIVDGLVDKDIAEDGVYIIIRPKSGTGAPYPDAAVGDVCVCSWGGVYVESAPLTAEQIRDPVNHPIVIHIVKAIILEVGDTDGAGLAVTFRVRDVVHNYSEDWCKATRLVVMTGTDLLDAPIVDETVNNVLDLDALGDNNITVHVRAQKPQFQLGDRIILKMRGTTVDKEAVEINAPPKTVDDLPHTYIFILLNADVRQLAKTQVTFSYHVERPGVSDPLPSKGQFVSFIGEPKRLAAPSAEAEQNGAIDPNLLSPRVRIPFDLIMLLGMGIELIWSGMRPDKSSYTPELEWHILSKEEIEAGEDLFIMVDGKHLKTLEGGTLDLSYYLLSEGPNGEIVRRESLHATQLKVGEPQFELVKPIVLGEQEGALEPNDWPNGIGKLTAPRPTVNPTQAGDKVFYKWVGEATGIKEDDILLNALTKDKDVHFTLSAAFVAEHIEPNRGKKVTVSYRIWRAATDETSYSNGLEFVVGAALELKPPSVVEADDKILNPINAKETLTIRVPANADLLPDHRISVHWAGAEGTPPEGSFTSPATLVSAGLDIRIPKSVVVFNLGKSVTVTYSVIIGSAAPKPSMPLSLSVQSIANGDPNLLPATIDVFSGDEIDVIQLSDNACTRVPPWPLIAANQKMWLRYTGTYEDDSMFSEVTYAGEALVGEAVTVGPHPPAPVDKLRGLKEGSKLEIEFKVTLDGNTDEGEAVTFMLRTYMVSNNSFRVLYVREGYNDAGPLVPEGGNTTAFELTCWLFVPGATGTIDIDYWLNNENSSHTPKVEPTDLPGVYTNSIYWSGNRPLKASVQFSLSRTGPKTSPRTFTYI